MESGLFAAGAACGCLQGTSRASRLRGQLGFILTTQPSRVVLFIYLFCASVCFHFSLCIYVKKKAVNLLLAAVLWPGLHGTLGSLAEFFSLGKLHGIPRLCSPVDSSVSGRERAAAARGRISIGRKKNPRNLGTLIIYAALNPKRQRDRLSDLFLC